MAHKKAAGSAKNLRDSQPKFRGVKIFGGQRTSAGNIIVRQCGNKYETGKNTYLANDFSIHAGIDGIVRFSKTNKVRFDGRRYLKTVVNVDPCVAKESNIAHKTTKSEKAIAVEKETKEVQAKKVADKKPTVKKTTTKKTTAKKVAEE